MRYLSLILILPLAAFAADPPDQVKRGKEVFDLKSSSGLACSTCHQVAGEGTAIGPDLAVMGRLSPRAIVTAILATRTQYVRDLTTKTGRGYPVIKSGEKFYDLSKNPPALVTPSAGEYNSAKDNAEWKHPPESRGLTKQQLADVIAFLRFSFLGDTKPVNPAEL